MNEFVFPEIKAGLYIVSLPIGCLSDISFRALHMLSNSDYVAGEDTRNVKSLFKLLKIRKSMKDIISYHDHSSANTRRKIIELIKSSIEKIFHGFGFGYGMKIAMEGKLSINNPFTKK